MQVCHICGTIRHISPQCPEEKGAPKNFNNSRYSSNRLEPSSCLYDNRYISRVLPFLVVVLTKSLVAQSRPLKQNHIIAPFVSSLDTFVLTAPIFDKPVAVAPSELKNIITEIPGRVFTRSAET